MPKKKKRRKAKALQFSSARQKANSANKQTSLSHLPTKTRDCTWLENDAANKELLRESKQPGFLDEWRTQDTNAKESLVCREPTSIDLIWEKFMLGHYHQLSGEEPSKPEPHSLLYDLQALHANVMKRCANELASVYVTGLLEFAAEHIEKVKAEFLQRWRKYYQDRLEKNYIRNVAVNQASWYKKFDESSKRQYFGIEYYKSKAPGEVEPKG